MPTGQTIINSALTALGILEQGGTPAVSDVNDALAELNSMWDAWGIDENLIYAVLSAQFSLVASTASYTIGAGATFNLASGRPRRIYKAVAEATVGAAKSRRNLRIIEAGEYYSHGDLAAAASSPDELYPDYNVDASGFATLYLWPVPTVPTATKLELEYAVPFTAWTLNGNYLIPFGFQDAVQYALAWRLIPRYGAAIAQEVAAVISELGQKSESRIIAENASNRMKPMAPPPAELPKA